MATSNEFIATALVDIGYKESPAGSNNTKYGAWIGLQNQPWCMSAVQYWAHKSDVELPVRTGSCTALMQAAMSSGQWITTDYKNGDIVIFQWGNGQRHCGVIVRTYSDCIVTIEGNTAVGNDSNGGEVMLRERPYTYVLGAVRPKFDTEVTPVDYDQFVKFLAQYREQLRDNDSNAYSADARLWATSNSIIQGNGVAPDGQPNYMWADFLTREQFVTMLYRFYLFLRG